MEHRELDLPIRPIAAEDVDEVLHHYQRAARELWKFCWLAGAGAGVERTARQLREIAAQGESIDWWELGAPRERDG